MDVDPSPAAWLHALDLRRAQRVIPVPGGAAVLHDDFPQAHDHNKLTIASAAEGAAIAAAADEVLGGAARAHRLIELRIPDRPGLTSALLAAGYLRTQEVVMTYEGPTTRARPAVDVVDLSLAQRTFAAEAGWREEQPDAGPDVWRQLGARIRTVTGAAEATFLGVVDEAGAVVARADVYSYEGRAQVEEVVTAHHSRGRGLASALVLDGVDRALAGGARQVFLVAAADDWPRLLYQRLGFRTVQTLSVFRR